MDPRIIEKINRLWEAIYPHLARFIADLYARNEGDVLELGPFAGGIAKKLLALSPGFRVVVADNTTDLFEPLLEQIRKTHLTQRLMTASSPLSPLIFVDQSFDLVVFRGAFFFLTFDILREIYRVLRPGGIAIVGGGYGPFTPQGLRGEIAEESKRLNQLLGKQWMTEADLAPMIQQAALQGDTEISHDGGLWVILRKKGDVNKEPPGLAQALALGSQEIISLVGGGGKTTLMFTLARELREQGSKVITTTTTKIFEPATDQTPCLVIEADQAHAMFAAKKGLRREGHITVAAQRFPGRKIGGVDPQLVATMQQELSADYIIVEADGACMLPLKAPGKHEPVIPSATTLLIPLVGIDALGRPLDEETAFRAERVAELTGTRLGGLVTPQLVATVMTHPWGLMKGAPAGARIIPVINKVETTAGFTGAREVAREVLEKGGRQIKRVMLSRLFFRQPHVEVVEWRDGSDNSL
jgi:probable selenium-dependent hydroxylase accessory protein YqeC